MCRARCTREQCVCRSSLVSSSAKTSVRSTIQTLLCRVFQGFDPAQPLSERRRSPSLGSLNPGAGFGFCCRHIPQLQHFSTSSSNATYVYTFITSSSATATMSEPAVVRPRPATDDEDEDYTHTLFNSDGHLEEVFEVGYGPLRCRIVRSAAPHSPHILTLSRADLNWCSSQKLRGRD